MPRNRLRAPGAHCQRGVLSNAESEDAAWELEREAVTALQQLAAACMPHTRIVEEAARFEHPSKHTAILSVLP